jgi:hypothetical protein
VLYEYDLLPPEGQEYEEKKLGEKPAIHKTSVIQKSRLGSWTDIGPRVSIVSHQEGRRRRGSCPPERIWEY